MDPLTSLIAANVAFVGGHFVLSHPLRGPLVGTLGEKGFLGLYSLFSLATFAWIVLAFQALGPGGPVLWDGQGTAPWIIASLLTVLATALLLGSLRGNPALPQTGADAIAQARATGVFAVTRHPMMWAIGIWAVAHVLVMPNPRTLVTAGSMGVLALVGAALQDGKKRKLLGEAWTRWEAQTSYWPRLGALGGIGIGLWIAAIVAWLLFTWLHIVLAYVPAGLWRWIG